MKIFKKLYNEVLAALELYRQLKLFDERIRRLEESAQTSNKDWMSTNTITVKDLWGQNVTPTVQIIDRCLAGDHDFPNPWWGVVPPYCRRCGQQALMGFVYTDADYRCATGTNIEYVQPYTDTWYPHS